MSTKIPYLDEVWNVTAGCSHAHSGCDHCYAEQWSHRLAAMNHADYQGLHLPEAPHSSHASHCSHHWNGVVRTLPHRLYIPRRWKRPRVIGVSFMSDLFHKSVPNDFILRILDVIVAYPQHRFIILTKRGQRMRVFTDAFLPQYNGGQAIPNLTLGVSVSTQAHCDDLLPHLFAIPAAAHIISLSPLLEIVDLSDVLWNADAGRAGIIIEAESGPGARPMPWAATHAAIEQARETQTCVYLKQISSNPDGSGPLLKDSADITRVFGQCPRELPSALRPCESVSVRVIPPERPLSRP